MKKSTSLNSNFNECIDKKEGEKKLGTPLGISMRTSNEMPTFKVRERMAMKIIAKKSAGGYKVSNERCESCEMPLLSMNDSLICKVCPALQKLVQMKNENEADTQNQGDDARDTTETIDMESSSRHNTIVDHDIDALADSDSTLRPTVKATYAEIAGAIESLENEVEIFPNNMDNGEVECSEKRENSLFEQNDGIQTHDEVGDMLDDIQLSRQESMICAEINSVSVESCQEDLKSSPYTTVAGIVMPTFRIRQRIAMKVAAKKTAQGYLLSDERCDLCEMPLLSLNNIVTCKVCPAIEKLAQKRTEVADLKNSIACNMFETAKASESCGIQFDEMGDTTSMNQKAAQDALYDAVPEKEEATKASASWIGRERMEMPTFRIRQRVAMKIVAKKTSQGFLISDKRCDLCEMPLLSMNGNLICKVCPAIEKWARKKNIEDAQEAGVTSTSEITVEVTESCDHDLVEYSFNDDTPKLILARNDESQGKDRMKKSDCKEGKLHAKSKSVDTEPLCEDVLNPINSNEYASQDDQGEISNQENDTVQDLHDALSPCSIITTRNDSFGDDERVGEIGIESPADEIKDANSQPNLLDVSTKIDLQDSVVPLLLNRHEVPSLVDNDPDLEEKSSKSRDDGEIEVVTTASNVQDDEHKIDVTQAFEANHSTQEIVDNCAGPGDDINDKKSQGDDMYPTETNEFQLHNKIICDDSTMKELQKAKFELSGILAGCKFDLMSDTVEKLRSIFNCNLNEAEDFRSMFVDERNQSFELEEQTMLLAMRGWIVTNTHCRRCAMSSMVLRPTDGEMMCPKCDDVEAGPAETFSSPLSPVQLADLSHLKARSHIGVPSHLEKWSLVDRFCQRCSNQLMRNPNLEADHCPSCGPVSTTIHASIQPTHPNNPTPMHSNPLPVQLKVDAVLPQVTITGADEPSLNIKPNDPSLESPSNERELAATDYIASDDDTKENDILDAIMLKELKETMKQIEEAKQFLLSRRTPRMMMSPPPTSANKCLYQTSPALLSNTMPSSTATVRAGILKPSGYHTPQLNNSGHQTPQIPGKYFFA